MRRCRCSRPKAVRSRMLSRWHGRSWIACCSDLVSATASTPSLYPSYARMRTSEPGSARNLANRSALRPLEWIQDSHVKQPEVRDVARDDGKVMDFGSRRNHRVFVQRVGLAMHDASPSSKDGCIHRQKVIQADH